MNSQTEQKTRTLASLTEAEAIEVAKLATAGQEWYRPTYRLRCWSFEFPNQELVIYTGTFDIRHQCLGRRVIIEVPNAIRVYRYLQSIGIDVPLD